MKLAPWTIKEVNAAWRLHTKGKMTVADIARATYEQKGYKNPDSCRRYLTQAFKDVILGQGYERKCKSCGVPLFQRTTGCSTCNSRHHYRKHAGTGLTVVAPRKQRLKNGTHIACGRCKGPIDELNQDCVTCRNRISKRKRSGYYLKHPEVKLRVRKRGGQVEGRPLGDPDRSGNPLNGL